MSEPKILHDLSPFAQRRHIETTDAALRSSRQNHGELNRFNMVLCAAPNCNVQYGQGVAMFRFPTEAAICDVWVRKLKTVD